MPAVNLPVPQPRLPQAKAVYHDAGQKLRTFLHRSCSAAQDGDPAIQVEQAVEGTCKVGESGRPGDPARMLGLPVGNISTPGQYRKRASETGVPLHRQRHQVHQGADGDATCTENE